MNAERARAFLLSLPHVVETMQFGENLVFWVGDKVIGGKMFCLIDLQETKHGVVSFAVEPERFDELLEVEGLFPAPYLARAHWIAARRWDALRTAEWEERFRAAHERTLGKMTERTRAALELPVKERKALITERRMTLDAAKAKKALRNAGRKAAK